MTDKESTVNDLIEKGYTMGAALIVTDLSLAYSHLFNDSAKAALSFKKKDRYPSREVKVITTTQSTVIDEVVYLSLTAVGPNAIYEAAKEIAIAINTLANKGFLTGYLSPISLLRLASEEYELKHYAVFCFPSLTQEGIEWLKLSKNVMCFPLVNEGECGEKVFSHMPVT